MGLLVELFSMYLLALSPTCLLADNTGGVNRDYFGSLCALYRLSETPETRIDDPLPSINQKRIELTNEIKKIAILCGVPPSKIDDGEELERKRLTWFNETDNQAGLEARKFTTEGEAACRQRNATTGLLRLLKSAGSVGSSVTALSEETKDWKKNVLAALKMARANTVNGQVTNEDSFTTNRGNSCSYNQKGPGKSLVNDMACICGQYTSGSDGKVCGPATVDVDWNDSNRAANKISDLVATCPAGTHQPLTAADIEEALSNFTRLLGSGLFSSTNTNQPRKRMHFGNGHASSDGTCDGTTNTDQNTCVNYHKVVEDAGGKMEGILWYKKFREVLTNLLKVQRQTALLKTDLAKLEALNSYAWGIYEGSLEGTHRRPDLALPGAKVSEGSLSQGVVDQKRKDGETQTIISAHAEGLEPLQRVVLLAFALQL